MPVTTPLEFTKMRVAMDRQMREEKESRALLTHLNTVFQGRTVAEISSGLGGIRTRFTDGSELTVRVKGDVVIRWTTTNTYSFGEL